MANILVVDDSVSMRQMVEMTLKSEGHTITTAADGQQGLQAAQASSFDAIVTDVNMPVMDGLEMTRQVRALPAHKFTPILVLTTESSDDKKAEGRAAGATGWLVKPFSPEKLIATINKVT
jgi:two-component system chemotaxis response regulator CheY